MINYNYSIDTYRNNQLNEYLNRFEEPESNICCESCNNDSEIKEYSKGLKGGLFESFLCLNCRNEHIKSFAGLKNYRAENGIYKIEKI